MAASSTLHFADAHWPVRRPKPFVLVIEGPPQPRPAAGPCDYPHDYLHDILLAPAWRAAFYDLIDATGLVVCLGVNAQHPTYRDVRGRSSKGRLSQGEYYHHDGCSGPTKPRFVEIRCPIQPQTRSIATAVAPHRQVVAAMLTQLPPEVAQAPAMAEALQRLGVNGAALSHLADSELDPLQGLITRSVRRKLKPEAARAYFRAVDGAADAYFEPWQLGESRFIANANAGVTMQHRRAYQTAHTGGTANGHLVKRWPNEELPLPGQTVDAHLIAALCREEMEDGAEGGAEGRPEGGPEGGPGEACYLGDH